MIQFIYFTCSLRRTKVLSTFENESRSISTHGSMGSVTFLWHTEPFSIITSYLVLKITFCWENFNVLQIMFFLHENKYILKNVFGRSNLLYRYEAFQCPKHNTIHQAISQSIYRNMIRGYVHAGWWFLIIFRVSAMSFHVLIVHLMWEVSNINVNVCKHVLFVS